MAITIDLPSREGAGLIAAAASAISFDDTLSGLGADNVQDAIDALAGFLIPSGSLDFSRPANSYLIGAL